MAYIRIILAGFFTFFMAFHSYGQFSSDPMGAYIADATDTPVSEGSRRTCAELARKAKAFAGAAAEMAAECAQKVGSNLINGIGSGVRGVASTGMAIGSCILSPVQCAGEIYDNTKAFINLMSQAVDKIQSLLSNIDPRQAALMACELIGEKVAKNMLRGGIPGILADISLSVAKFAALGPAAIALQKLGLAIDLIINIDKAVMDQVSKLSSAAKAVFAREAKMCSI